MISKFAYFLNIVARRFISWARKLDPLACKDYIPPPKGSLFFSNVDSKSMYDGEGVLFDGHVTAITFGIIPLSTLMSIVMDVSTSGERGINNKVAIKLWESVSAAVFNHAYGFIRTKNLENVECKETYFVKNIKIVFANHLLNCGFADVEFLFEPVNSDPISGSKRVRFGSSPDTDMLTLLLNDKELSPSAKNDVVNFFSSKQA